MMQKSSSEKILEILLPALATICCLILFKTVYEYIVTSTVPFDTDEADHTNPALQLYTALIRGDISLIYNSIVRQAFYPPLYSFLVAGSYLTLSPDFISSRLPTLLTLIAYVLLLTLSVRIFLKDSGKTNYLNSPAFLCGLLAVTSPITLNNSVLCMLEIPGMLCVTAVLLSFININKNFTGCRLFLIFLAGISVFFTKYNFGIITIPALIATVFFTAGFKPALKISAATLLTIAAWALLTDFPQFLHFFKGHKSYAPMFSAENIFFELRAWLNVYCVNFYVAAAVLLLTIPALIKEIKQPAVMFSALNTFFAFFVLLLSTTNEERHFMVAIPCILFMAAISINLLFESIKKLTPYLYVISYAVIIGLALIRLPATAAELKQQFEGEQTFAELFEFIYNNTDSSNPLLFYGISDDFSIEALRWYFAARSQQLYTEVLLDAYPYRPDKNFTARMRNRNLDIPFKDRTFPQKPASKVMERNYYHYAVHINNTAKKQRFLKEGEDLRTTVSQFKVASKSLGSREIEIFKIK